MQIVIQIWSTEVHRKCSRWKGQLAWCKWDFIYVSIYFQRSKFIILPQWEQSCVSSFFSGWLEAVADAEREKQRLSSKDRIGERYEKVWRAEKRAFEETNGDDGILLVCLIKLISSSWSVSLTVWYTTYGCRQIHTNTNFPVWNLFVCLFLCDLVIHPFIPSISSSSTSLVVIA